jgi:hypothetical protein
MNPLVAVRRAPLASGLLLLLLLLMLALPPALL